MVQFSRQLPVLDDDLLLPFGGVRGVTSAVEPRRRPLPADQVFLHTSNATRAYSVSL